MNLYKKIFSVIFMMFLFVIGVSMIPIDKADATVAVTVDAVSKALTSGGSTRITWNATGSPSYCTYTTTTDGVTSSPTTVSTSGYLDTGTLTKTTTYNFTCTFVEYCYGTYTVEDDGYCATSPTSTMKVTGSRDGTTVPGPYEGEYCVNLSQSLCETGGWIIHGCGAGWTPNVYNCSGLTNTSTCGAHSTCKWVSKSEEVTHYYTVTGSAGTGGTISPTTTSLLAGKKATLTIAPDGGYSITSVTGCGGTLSGTTYTTDYLYSDCTVSATFTTSLYRVTTTSNSGGSISPIYANVAGGSIASFKLTPNSGYKVCAVTGCDGTLSGTIYDTGPITGSCTVNATFAASTNNCLMEAIE